MSTSSCTTKKRNRSELVTNTNDEPAPKKSKLLSPAEIISKFITDKVKSTSQILSAIHAISELIKQSSVSTELINSYFTIMQRKPPGFTHRTILAQIIHNISVFDSYTKPNQQILAAHKNLFILIINAGANAMLSQETNLYFWRNPAPHLFAQNISNQASMSIFKKIKSKHCRDIKFNSHLFAQISDLKIGILNLNFNPRRCYYFAGQSDTTEFTFDIGIKGLCWLDLLQCFQGGWRYAYNYSLINDKIITDKDRIAKAINEDICTEQTVPVWLLHLFILKEYYKVYPLQFEQCFGNQLPLDIIHILKEYCILNRDYSWLDSMIDENAWVQRCILGIGGLTKDWRHIFYRIIISNEKYRNDLLDWAVRDRFEDIYTSVYDLIWNDESESVLEYISDNPSKLVHFMARNMQFGHSELLHKLLVKIERKYEFSYDSFMCLGDGNESDLDWCNVLNFCIIYYGNHKICKSMFNTICDSIRKYCLSDQNIVFNVSDKMWSKREWIHVTKWTKYKLECLRIMQSKLNLDLNKAMKYCDLKQNGQNRISTIKLVDTILKYKKERNSLLDYTVCKERNYLRNVRQIISDDKQLPNKMMKTVQSLSVSFQLWENENTM